MKKFSESERFNYPLDSTSLVIDCGAFDGLFARNLASLYGCRIIAFEPIRKYFEEAVCNTAAQSTVCVINAALSFGGATAEMGVANNSSGWFSQSPEREVVSIVRVVPFLTCIGKVALFKCNIEGAEYSLLETILNAGLHLHIDNLQIQFHNNVPEWEQKYKTICERLSKTHVQEWSGAEFTWENHRLK